MDETHRARRAEEQMGEEKGKALRRKGALSPGELAGSWGSARPGDVSAPQLIS